MTAMLFVYQGYSRIPLGDTVAIFCSNTVWSSLIAFLVLKEKIHVFDMFAIPLTMIGIIFMSQPTFIFGARAADYDTVGLFYAVGSSFLAASAFNIIRKIGKRVHYTITVFYFSISGVLIQIPIILATGGFHYPCRVSLVSTV